MKRNLSKVPFRGNMLLCVTHSERIQAVVCIENIFGTYSRGREWQTCQLYEVIRKQLWPSSTDQITRINIHNAVSILWLSFLLAEFHSTLRKFSPKGASRTNSINLVSPEECSSKPTAVEFNQRCESKVCLSNIFTSGRNVIKANGTKCLILWFPATIIRRSIYY